jgi:predicted amidohydrolase YtcJ
LPREEALKSMTIQPAHENFQERLLGSISPGKYAEFVVMDRDWMRVAPDEIMQTRILATYLGGARVYQGDGGLAVDSRGRKGSNSCSCSQLAAVYEAR